jgi:hypothetical protein
LRVFTTRWRVSNKVSALGPQALWIWLITGVIALSTLIGIIYLTNSIFWTEPVLPQNPRPLGTTKLISGPTPCADQNCYEIEVSCPEVAQPEQVILKVGDPTGSPSRGTILFASGWIGTFLWEERGPDAVRILKELRAAGFRTVQLNWMHNWYYGAPGQQEGYARLACRPATVARWVHDNLHNQSPETAFCATGHSNGAAQVSYMLTHYGQADLFSTVVLEGGPNFARMDQACIHTWFNRSLRYPQNDAQDADWGFGFQNDGTGPCGRHDATFRQQFQEASIAFGGWDYVYPKTMIRFLMGAQDDTATAAQGRIYYERLKEAGTPLLGLEIIPEASHDTISTKQGAEAIRDNLLNECYPR